MSSSTKPSPHAPSLADTLRTALSTKEKGLVRDLPPGEPPPTPAGVLVCLFDRGEGTQVLYTRRTETVGTHKGQISFPGGAREPHDETIRDTALRETFEEVGLTPAAAELLGELDDHITISNYLVTPVVAWIAEPPPVFAPRPEEVAEVLEIPLAVLRDPARLREEDILWLGEQKRMYSFDTGRAVVWGLTARITVELLGVLALAPGTTDRHP